MSALLHYICDPLCGWCYGAEPLVWASRRVRGLELRFHAGGLWPRPTRLPEETRRYIQQADARIASMSGQPFGDAYLSGLLLDPTTVLDSRPPIGAVLAAQSLNTEQTLPMLRGIQHAHYEQGRRVVEPAVLAEIAVELGIDRDAFAEAFEQAPVDTHIEETRQLMSRVGAPGFPTFALQIDDRISPVPHQRFPSDAAGFRRWLETALSGESSLQGTAPTG